MRTRSLLSLVPALLVTAVLASACGDDDEETSPAGKPDCEAIVEACHPVDPGDGPIHECHENAEAETVTNADCQAAKAACVALCEGAASDAGQD